MQFTRYCVILEAELKFTEEELDLLFYFSNRHYDGYCQSISRVGGFLYGWRQVHKADMSIFATAHELNTILKVCEMSGFCKGDENRTEQGTHLYWELHKCFVAMVARAEELNQAERLSRV